MGGFVGSGHAGGLFRDFSEAWRREWVGPILEVRVWPRAGLIGAILEQAYAEDTAVILTEKQSGEGVFSLCAVPLNSNHPLFTKKRVFRHLWCHWRIGIGPLNRLQDFAVC
jgi:hypothetical protein